MGAPSNLLKVTPMTQLAVKLSSGPPLALGTLLAIFTSLSGLGPPFPSPNSANWSQKNR